uniref:Uncharacterized protein n=1 Tax=Aegilops tauschii subsp. strangulata TaxID=200361 RepID=A0A453BSY4_AEGTS
EVPITPLVEQSSAGKALPSTPSQMIKTPIPYGRSPLPRNKDKVLSVATPETPKLRSSRSGRLIVPRLDPGTQNIIYDAGWFYLRRNQLRAATASRVQFGTTC